MAGPVQRQAGKDLSLFAVPKPLKKEQEAEEQMRELQLDTVRTVNAMLDLARKHEKDLPRIDEDNFSINTSSRMAMVIQSGGAIISVDTHDRMDPGPVSVYWAGKKFTLG